MLEIPEIDDVSLAFPANALDWMPPMDEIPEEYRKGKAKTCEIVHHWFFSGLNENVEFHPRRGVDAEKAWRAVSATIRSFAPSHQHKEAAAAYMLDSWFKKIKGWK
jgi:hypothetical protein